MPSFSTVKRRSFIQSERSVTNTISYPAFRGDDGTILGARHSMRIPDYHFAEPHHLTIPDFSDADIWGESMSTTDLNDYPWKMDAVRKLPQVGIRRFLSPIDAECDRTTHMEEHANISPGAQAPKQSCSMPSTEEELATQGPCTTELETSKAPLNPEVTLEVTQGNHDTVSLAEDSREALHLLVENALHSTSRSTASEVDTFQYFNEEHVVEQQVPNSVTEDIREAPTETNIRRVNDVETEEPQYIRPEISEPASGVPHLMQVHETITREQLTEDADTRDAGPEIDGLLVAEARPTEQQATEDAVGDAARERVIPHELEPREDLSPLYDREVEEINGESTVLKKHSDHGGEVCEGWRPRKRLRGIEGTSIETAIMVDDDNDDDNTEIRRSTRTTIPPNQPGMVRWADPSFMKTAAEDFQKFWHTMKICWCVGTPLYPPVGSLPSFDLKHLPRRNAPKEFRQFALLMKKVSKRAEEKGGPEKDAALTLWKEWKKICDQILLDTGDDDDSRCQQHGLREFDLLLRLLVKKEEVYQCTQISGKNKGIKKRKRQP
ncbi:hypothetical protein K469DRAFT_717428 [Zopfia rhizophila CBS 207.26]|uniref:Uncharacterized protein n=1 Tax=Zopfia rhizophila CBS 207.26 TaxID=1314779 RepID=A0A6A6DL29_9PEZI|nr:hypothetical protein K469DRAFT_717428 [Zopfia rhizophila CBS 207.26]